MDYANLASTCNSLCAVLTVFAVTAFGLLALHGDFFDTNSLMFHIAKTLLVLACIALLWFLQFTYGIKSQLFAELNWLTGAVSLGLVVWSAYGFVRIFRDY